MGRPPVITREKAAETALRIIDEDGLDGLSLERLAKAMGVRGPSLYHHFADKNAILTEVAQLVIGDLGLQDLADRDWRDWLVDVALTFYAAVMEHPRAATILIQNMPERSAVPGFGRAAKKLTEAGVDPSLQFILMEGCEMMAWGWALQRATLATLGQTRMPAGRIPRRWPELAVAVAESRWPEEDLLKASLHAFIDGVMHQADEGKPKRRPAKAAVTSKAAAKPAAKRRTPATSSAR